MDSDGAPVAPVAAAVRVIAIAPSNFRADENGTAYLARLKVNVKDYNSVKNAFKMTEVTP